MVMSARQLGLDDLCVHQVCLSGQYDFLLALLLACGWNKAHRLVEPDDRNLW